MLRVALLLALLASPAAAQNLLVNPGFERGLDGWGYLEDRAGVVEPSSTAHDGAAGLLLTVPPAMPGAASLWQDVRGLSKGGRYCVSAWFLSVAEGGGFGLAVDEPERRVAEVLVYGQPSGWTWARACFHVQKRRVRVRIWPSPGLVAGGGWVDSVALVGVMRENDPVCLVCGRRCPGAEVLYVRPNGNTHQAVALCGKRCRRAYNGPSDPDVERSGVARP